MAQACMNFLFWGTVSLMIGALNEYYEIKDQLIRNIGSCDTQAGSFHFSIIISPIGSSLSR